MTEQATTATELITSLGVPKEYAIDQVAGRVGVERLRSTSDETSAEISTALREGLISQAEAMIATFPAPSEGLVPGLVNIAVVLTASDKGTKKGPLSGGQATGVVVFMRPLAEGEIQGAQQMTVDGPLLQLPQASQGSGVASDDVHGLYL